MGDLHARLLAATEQPMAGLSYTTGFLRAKVNALRAVVELHAPVRIDGITFCPECRPVGRKHCSTIRAIAEALGVPTGDAT